MMLYSRLILITLAYLTTLVSGGTESKNWICNSLSNCVSTDSKSAGNEDRIYENQNVCLLSCGKYGSIWPQPTKETVLSHDRVYFDPWKVRFNLVAPSSQTSQYLGEVNRIFISNILRECKWNCTLSNSKEVLVKVTVNSSDLRLDWDTDESYNLSVRSSDVAVFVDIKAQSVYGARHGIETLTNLITGSNGNGLVIVGSAKVKDAPIYKHRGLLLDTARNYLPPKSIKAALDAMATSKLNVFHWHATDSHSFPLEITRVPELQRFGAYSAEEIYTRSDIQNIIKYAKVRGIRVLIELDAPSHSGNGWQWGPMAGLGDLAVCIDQQPWRKFCIQPPCGQLNPINENVYSVLKEIFEDIAEVIPDEETMHMGGDEVFIPCWNNTKQILDHLKSRGLDTSMSTFLKLWADFHSRNLESWDEVNNKLTSDKENLKSVILWSSHLTEPEIIEQYLSNERYIIQTWVNSTNPLNTELLKRGYRIIASTKDAWYLDHGFWGITQYYNWKKVYSNRLQRNPAVLGGEACMWGEYVDENSIEGRVWPRAGAAAERLWSDPGTSAVAAEQRFIRYRERLISRGIKPDAITPRWCTLHQGECL